MPSGHTERDTINQRRPLTENMRATLRLIVDDASVPVSRMTQQQKNAARALHDRGLALWIDYGKLGSYISTDAGRSIAAGQSPELGKTQEIQAPAEAPADGTTLAAWVAAEKARLDEFAAWWTAEQSGERPELFHAALPDGEWDEQYRGWGGG